MWLALLQAFRSLDKDLRDPSSTAPCGGRSNFAEEVLFQQGFHACLIRMEQHLKIWVDDVSTDSSESEEVEDAS